MKTTLKLFSLFTLLFAFVACSEDNEGTVPEFTVTAISAESATVGTEITITGTNFPEASDINLTFGGVAANVSSATSTQIVTAVPNGASSGAVTVTANGITREVTPLFQRIGQFGKRHRRKLGSPSNGWAGTTYWRSVHQIQF